ncbi:hypothetical protein AWC38_SpisGene11968 [Stylophora pistillata]|uniref:Uncharacterized protein n=1 Tax=Stylophora pistillata TaxID=50429 RepID=A0A2B4S4S5_STYPI|nr:hypothetical protein AWC38_SpisGene11968 [Stylophora pistillata]
MERKLSRVYYSPKGFWKGLGKGLGAVKKLAEEARVPEDVAKLWLTRQAIWQIYLASPKHIPWPTFDVDFPNAVHQADLLFLPHDKLFRKVYKYALTVVNVTSRFKAAEPLTSKESLRMRSTEWVKRLPEVVSALNHEKTRLTGKKPIDAIKEKVVDARSSTSYSRPVSLKEKRLDYSKNVRYLYAPGELEGGQRIATDPIWSLKVFNIKKALVNEKKSVLYYLKDGPKRGFVREELQIVPPKTELPPEGIQ